MSYIYIYIYIHDISNLRVNRCEIVITTRLGIWGNYFNIIFVRLVQLEIGNLYTEKRSMWNWGYVRFNICKDGDSKYREV